MNHSIDIRCRRDLKNLADDLPERRLQDLLRQWINDPEWWNFFSSISVRDRSNVLSELGHYAAEHDLGGYRTCIQGITDSIQEYLNCESVVSLPDRHIEHLFVSLGDNVTFASQAVMSSEFDRVDIQGIEHLDHALQQGRGAMVLSAAQSHPAFAFKHPRFSELGISTVGNLGPDGSERNSPFFKGLEDRVEILPASVAAVRKLIHRLRNDGVVAVYGDFRFSDSGAAIGLQFGRPVLFAKSAASIAIKHHSPVIPTTVARQWPLDSGPIEVRFFPPVLSDDFDDTTNDRVGQFALRMSVAVDGMIRRFPAHWRLWYLLIARWQEAITVGNNDTLVPRRKE